MVLQLEPVENEINAARTKIKEGIKYGLTCPPIARVIKSAVRNSSVTMANDQANTRIMIAGSMVLKPVVIQYILSFNVITLFQIVINIAEKTPVNDAHINAWYESDLPTRMPSFCTNPACSSPVIAGK